MRTKHLPARLFPLALLMLAGGCLYRMPVQQGNMLENSQVEQLQTGMTRTQVAYLLGTPMVPDAFHKDRWDYFHYLDLGRGNGGEFSQTRRLTVWFKDDKVERIEDSASQPKTAAPGPAPAQGATAPSG
jgi:outer membrane protein assembly factor BamE